MSKLPHVEFSSEAELEETLETFPLPHERTGPLTISYEARRGDLLDFIDFFVGSDEDEYRRMKNSIISPEPRYV